eukprot:3117928-Rhodomonas_salina.4
MDLLSFRVAKGCPWSLGVPIASILVCMIAPANQIGSLLPPGKDLETVVISSGIKPEYGECSSNHPEITPCCYYELGTCESSESIGIRAERALKQADTDSQSS